MNNIKFYGALFLGIAFSSATFGQQRLRKSISLDANWHTAANDSNKNAYQGFEQLSYVEKQWKKVDVPHNWDEYGGYRRMMHGNRHGYAWYRKTMDPVKIKSGKRYFLWFEGVGSYATVFLNGKKVGAHAGGRTTFTIDITDFLNKNNKPNLLAVKADHPADIRDLPWVCGGCSEERGFSEGSQPMGIFRPVHLIETSELRITPFGVHVWNDTTVSARSATLNMETELKNYGNRTLKVQLRNKFIDKDGRTVFTLPLMDKTLGAGQVLSLKQQSPVINNPHLWSIEDPYLYTLRTEVLRDDKVIDELDTKYGIRWISWPVGRKGDDKRFFLNGKPVLINGVAEYEHLIGQSHAFTSEQIHARAMQIKAAGFNSLRDAHQPHNLRYQEYWDREGILWWPQMAAHIWFDNPAFRQNFKTLMTDWIKERRNSPSIILWGLENESTLPEAFAKECSDLIRKLDPTASSQRKITTCNGGTGTDWNVPQNWTGTYGGDPATYAEDLKRQLLVGEYGAWRTMDLHTEGKFKVDGVFSEDRMTQLMELKVKLAEEAKDKTTGHYFWIFNSHDNPGRVQGGEGKRELDRIGPVNYKGLLTSWEEPGDVFYMFRSNFAPAAKSPMVYIVSHTWPDRWSKPGLKDGITVYSNCDQVELFNDIDGQSLGKRSKQGIGTHFQWDQANIQYNVLYAVGYVAGKAVARDCIVLRNLPQAPHFDKLYSNARNLTEGAKGFDYVYRVNCGGPDFKDQNGNIWQADRHLEKGTNAWGSLSWTDEYPGMPAFFASQRRVTDPIAGTRDWDLFQTFRYGRDKLKYEFPLPDGEYQIELYFMEPWFGTGGGLDCSGWRLFDVAANGKTLVKDLDLWKEAGRAGAVKKTFVVNVKGGKLVLDFPHIKASQAVISAIAIAAKKSVKPASAPQGIVAQLKTLQGAPVSCGTWLDTGDQIFGDADTKISDLPSSLYGADWIVGSSKSGSQYTFSLNKEADVFVASSVASKPSWLKDFQEEKETLQDNADMVYKVYRKRFTRNAQLTLGEKAEAFFTAIVPASSLQPAFDLKKSVNYKAPKASFTPGIVTATVNGKDAVTFNKASGDVLEWTIQTGVADTYSMTVKYANTTGRKLKATLELRLLDGTLMKTEEAELLPSRTGKWNYYATSTGTMINAGTYKVRLIAIDAADLSISGLDVQ